MLTLIKTYLYTTIFCLLGLNLITQEHISEAEIKSIRDRIEFNINYAQKNINNNNFYKAKNDLDQALELAKQINENKSIGLIYSKMGKLYYIQENPEEAIKTLVKAIEKQRTIKDHINIAETYKTLGLVYLNLKKKYNNAIDYFNSAEFIFENEDLLSYKAETKMYKADAYFNLKNYELSTNLYKEVISLSERCQNDQLLSISYLKLGQTKAILGEIIEGEHLANLGFQIAEENGFINILNTGYKIKSHIKEIIGDYKASNSLLKTHLKLNDSLLKLKYSLLAGNKNLDFLHNISNEYQKEKEADLQKQANSFWLQKLTTILSIALITILSLLTLSLYKNNNIRLKSNNILHKKNTELTIAMEKAESATKAKTNFLSTVTHELRTPLYAVTGLTSMLLEENPKPEQIQHLKSLKFSGDYLLTFINDILQINKIEANKVDIEPEIFNLKKKVENIISALNNSALNNNTNIHFEYDTNLHENFKADQLKISQILINLIGNSIKFTKNGDIWIRIIKQKASGDNLEIRFEIEDNGIGISKEKQQNIFESFSQGSIQINRKYGGTGLGLSIVKGLIDILKGKIYLKSELGKGTTFVFELPLKKSHKEVKLDKPNYFKDVKELELLSNIRILIVEDNKINQMITKKILDKMNLHSDIADNGEEAVDKVKTGTYDVVLMDIHMPGISGIEATKMIRDFDRELPIFALTAVTIEDKIQEFDEAGFTDIIPKPFKQEDFERKLYDALISNNSQVIQE